MVRNVIFMESSEVLFGLQLSVMRVFSQILSDMAFRAEPHSAEVIRFCTEISRSLFSRLVPASIEQTAAGIQSSVFHTNQCFVNRLNAFTLRFWH